MARGLVLGDPALVDQGLHERVVPRDLREHAVAEEVGAGVADVHHAEPAAREQHRGERGAHAVEVGLLADELGDRVVALGGGLGELAQEVVAGLVVVERHEGGDDQLRGHLAGRVSAHAVGEGEQARARVDRVLVVLPYQAPVTASGVAQHQGHGTILHGRGWGNDTRVRMTGVSAAELGRRRGHDRSSMTVLPIRIGVPSGTRVGPETLLRSRYVPLVDPRSSTYQSSPDWEIRAWRVDA